jgi:O-antigen ligase
MVSLGTFRERSFGTILSRLVAAKASRPSIVFCACAFTMVASLLLGGGTRGGFLSDAILELLAIPALLLVVPSLIDALRRSTHVPRSTSWALMLCFAIALLPLLQLVPLPPWIWTKLPGREAILAIFNLVGGQGNWMPMSVSPNATWLSLLSLVPPMAIFLGAIQLGYRERRGLSLVVISVGIFSAFLGLIQVAQGPTSPLRFAAFTDNTEAVGFFANRNDFAALLYMVLVFTAAWAIDIAFKAVSWRHVRSAARIVMLTAAFLVLIVLIAAEAMARSRAGLVLTIVALAGMFAMASAERPNASGIGPGKLLLGATLLAVMLAVQFTLYRVMDRFALEPMEDARLTFARNTVSAASAFMPFGAGVGTFVPVYAMFEAPSDTIGNFYINHAHNDFLEVWLETGVFGMALFGGFLIVLGFRSVELWWRPPDEASKLDRLLMRAAPVAIALLIAHSFVEYPLRTGAIMAIFAFSCALLIEPLAGAEDATMAATEPRRVSVPRQPAENLGKTAIRLSSSQVSSAIPAQRTEISQPPPRQLAGRWGEEIAWPAEWQKSKVQKPPDAPSQSGGAAPSQTGATAPSQAGAAAPSQSGGTAPSQSGAAAPSQSGAAAPSQSGGAAPSQPSHPGAAAPSQSGGTAPSQSGAAAPSQSGGTAPSQSGTATPSQAGGTAPSQSGAAAPSQSGAAARSQSGGAAPSQSAGTAPSQSGAAAPPQSGAAAPSQSGGAGPTTANPAKNK